MNSINYTLRSNFDKTALLLSLSSDGIRVRAILVLHSNDILLFYHTEPRSKLGFMVWLTTYKGYFLIVEPRVLVKITKSPSSPYGYWARARLNTELSTFRQKIICKPYGYWARPRLNIDFQNTAILPMLSRVSHGVNAGVGENGYHGQSNSIIYIGAYVMPH